jgi:cytochrome c oxidase subunit IV
MEHNTSHRIPYGLYVMIWFGLVALTGLTVAVAGVDLGRWVVITAMGIASVKAMLVLNYFMHLRFEDRVFRLFVVVTGVTLAIFIGMTFFDYAFS